MSSSSSSPPPPTRRHRLRRSPAQGRPPSNSSKQPQPLKQQQQRNSAAEDEIKWWNEYPLEGDPKRPAVMLTNILSKSPRLIGWDDDRIEARAREARRQSLGISKEQEEKEETTAELHLGPKREVVNQVAFGLLGVAAKEVTKHLLHLEEQRDAAGMPPVEMSEAGIVQEAEPDLEASTINSSEVQKEEEEVSVAGRPLSEDQANDNMRETELYQLALRSLRWQRDNYLVGREYADDRKAERRRRQSLLSMHPNLPIGLPLYLPFDESALGNQQIVRLGQWFLPSPVVQRALLPIVVGLPSGPLNQPILRATVNLIPMSQGNLNNVVKSRLLWFLQDEGMRDLIKHSTNGYIANTYRDSSSNGKVPSSSNSNS